MNLYTFVLEYEGGTYISQIEADSPNNGSKLWAENLDEREIYNFGSKSKEILLAQISEETPVPIMNIENVWCVSYIIRGKLALVNIVQTQKGFN